jgi:GNAT superfamily N-acetyltransferase
LSQSYRLVHELDEGLVVQLHSLYRGEWWSRDRMLDDTRRCVAGSQLCFALLNDADRLVAFARVLTDFVFKAFIFDVIVAADHRARGLGDAIMQNVLQHERLRHVRHFELYCLPEMIPYYRRLGFSEEVGAVRLMRRVSPS